MPTLLIHLGEWLLITLLAVAPAIGLARVLSAGPGRRPGGPETAWYLARPVMRDVRDDG